MLLLAAADGRGEYGSLWSARDYPAGYGTGSDDRCTARPGLEDV
jgi:hypothetical protein